MARYAIPSHNAFGVSMAGMKVLAERLGRNHELAAALWDTGWYEARMLATLIDEPARVTPAQMDRWCRDFDNWGICDTACFALFDRTPHAWAKVAQWSGKRDEFGKRAACAVVGTHGSRQADRQRGISPGPGSHRATDSPQASARWVGKHALRELTSASVVRRLAARA
ncbi:MAG: DNA alkylation repair protein [Gemmatimonadales bacterium]